MYFGWIKTVCGRRKARLEGLEKLSGHTLLIFATRNLARRVDLMRPGRGIRQPRRASKTIGQRYLLPKPAPDP